MAEVQLMRHRQEKQYADTGERQVFFVVVGTRGATSTSFLLLDGLSFRGHNSVCTGIDFHSPVPRYEGQDGPSACIWIEAEGFCDGTSLPGVPAEEWFDAGDEETIFAWLERRYLTDFGGHDETYDLTSDRFGHGPMAGAGHVEDVPLSASEPNRPKTGR